MHALQKGKGPHLSTAPPPRPKPSSSAHHTPSTRPSLDFVSLLPISRSEPSGVGEGEGRGYKRTFPPAIELHRDPLVHVFLQVQDVLLLRPLLVLALAPLPAVGTACAAAAPASSTTATPASRTAVPAAVGSVGHCWLLAGGLSEVGVGDGVGDEGTGESEVVR